MSNEATERVKNVVSVKFKPATTAVRKRPIFTDDQVKTAEFELTCIQHTC